MPPVNAKPGTENVKKPDATRPYCHIPVRNTTAAVISENRNHNGQYRIAGILMNVLAARSYD